MLNDLGLFGADDDFFSLCLNDLCEVNIRQSFWIPLKHFVAIVATALTEG